MWLLLKPIFAVICLTIILSAITYAIIYLFL